MMRFVDIPANDIEQALRYYRECNAAGTWSSDKAQALLMLQDNPDALLAEIARAKERTLAPG